jgi:hypothetical protein
MLSVPTEVDGELVALHPRIGMIDYRGEEAVELVAQRAEAALEQARLDGKRTYLAGAMQTASA